MIYFATIHWKDSRWIKLQHEMLKKHVLAPFKTYAYVNGIDDEFFTWFDKVLSGEDPPHELKLNMLADLIVADSASDGDWMIFIDGDAFPIAPLVEKLKGYFDSTPLVAIQRLENLGEKHTHPSFTATTVGFWKKINGDWNKGYTWINTMGNEDSDVGANIYGKLQESGIAWRPFHRTNTTNLHPVFFGVYDDLIYHHGAGFRAKECRQMFYEAGLYDLYKRWDVQILSFITPGRFAKQVRNSIFHPEGRLKRRANQRKEILEEQVYQRILHEPNFFQSLING